MTIDEMLQELGQIDGHGDPCEAHSLIRLNSFEANAIAAALKAGQAMDRELTLGNVIIRTDGKTIGQQAWDLATKDN